MSDLKTVAFSRADGGVDTLADHEGEVVLVVNVASKCGLTPQYESLERLYSENRDRGLMILAFPCNQFRGQEPGSDEEIQDFCRSTYGVEFPVLAKIAVNGPERHPLYAGLTSEVPDAHERADGGMRARLAQRGIESSGGSDVLWNFEKFLIARDGKVVGRFAPDITVEESPLREAIEQELNRRV
jgi:glutathione peroxidase